MSPQRRLRQRMAPAALITALAALLLSACGSESVTAVEPSIVVISPGEETLYLDQTREFSAEVQDADGNALPDRDVEWSSTDPDVASVGDDGVVEAHAEGTAEIRAAIDDLTGTATVTVLDRPTIVLSETSASLQAEAGEAGASEEEIEVMNGGDREIVGLTIDVSYREDEPDGWLDASIEEVTTPTTLTLRASAADLSGGTFHAQVDVASDSAGNSPQTVEVTFQVGASEPVIELSTDEVEFNAIEGRPRPADQTVSITNGGEQDLTGLSVAVFYGDGPTNDWLSTSLDGTEAPTELTLSVADDGLVAGDYEANVRVEAEDAVNSPASILVLLHVQAGANPETSTIEANPEELEANGSDESVITVTLKDADGEDLAIGGDDVTLATTAGTLSDVTDNDDGTYTATLTSSSTPEVATITGTVNGQAIAAEATVVFAVGSVSTSNSTVEAEPVTLVADGVSTSTITVTVRDAQGHVREDGGDDVALQASAGAVSAVTDNANGTYTATLTSSTTAGTATVTASVNGNDLDEGVDVEFVPGDPSPQLSTIAADPDSIDADGESTSTITVTVMDAQGNVRDDGGDAVVISSTGGTVSAVTDEGDGTYTATLTSGTVVGTAVVSATVNGTPLAENTAVQFGPAESSTEQSSIEASPARILLGATSTITVTIRDDFGNVRSAGGDDVGLEASAGRLSRVRDNADGTYTATFTARGNPPLRTAIITGTVNSMDIQDTAQVTYLLPLDSEDAGTSAPELEATESVA